MSNQNPVGFCICSICKAVHDSATTTAMWFVSDQTITPLRGFVCGACMLARNEAGKDPTYVGLLKDEPALELVPGEGEA